MFEVIFLLISVIMIGLIFSFLLMIDNVKDVRKESSYLDSISKARRIHPRLERENNEEENCEV